MSNPLPYPRRLAGASLRLLLLAFCAALFVVAAGADPADDAWTPLEDPDATPTQLATALTKSIATLEDAGFGYEAEDLTLFAREQEKEKAEHFGALFRKARELLRAAGFASEAPEDGVLVVYVRRPFLTPLVVAAPDKLHVLLVRQPTILSHPQPPPELQRAREAPRARTLVRASDEAVVYLDEAVHASRFAAGPGSPAFGIARAAVAGARLPASSPAWLLDGLAAWLEAELSGQARRQPLHLCGSLAPSDRKFLESVLPAKGTPAPQAVRLLGRYFGKVRAADTSLHTAAVAAGTDPSGGIRALEAGFGKDAPAALRALAKADADPAPACKGKGRIECPTCRGGGRAKVACWTCAGLKHVACPNCRGMAVCTSTACSGGWRVDTLADTPCRLCRRGFYYCYGCEGKVRMPCKVCAKRGAITVPCPTCRGSRHLPCPEQGGGDTLDALTGATSSICLWCDAKKLRGPCGECGGSGHGSCKDCFGSQLVKCPSCDGKGCRDCKERGRGFCSNCTAHDKRCAQCSGKGATALQPQDCLLCRGRHVMPDSATRRARLAAARRGPTAEEAKTHQAMLERAIAFLLTCRRSKHGTFALRDERPNRTSKAGTVDEPSLFSNAMVLGALGAAGLGPSDARVAHAWKRLEQQADAVLRTGGTDANIQSVSLCLRALMTGGADPTDARIQGLVELVAGAQRSNGLWALRFGGKHEGESYQALYAIESLYIASRRGAKVSDGVWRRALAGATRAMGEVRKSRKKKGWITATDVASGVALILMTRAGIAREAPASLEEYRRIPAVEEGLAWLERHFDIRREAVIKNGCLVTLDSDPGFSAYLYAIQRLAQLLKIDELGGERWHTTGARYLLGRQLSDGSFEELGRGRLNGPVRCTSSAVLFLLRATPPLTEK